MADTNDVATTSAAVTLEKTISNSANRRRSMRQPTKKSTIMPDLEQLRRATSIMLMPERKLAPPPSFGQSLKHIALASYLNILLVCIPISWAFHFALKEDDKNKDILVFVFAFLAIIPLAKLLALATDELSMRVGQTLAGLLNATLGNAVELIISIVALIKCELRIVQASLVGSILSNLLLVLGMCFFCGGLKYSEQGFGASATQLNSSLLTISVIAVLLPAAFHLSFTGDVGAEGKKILSVSHGVALILIFIYGAYLYFQLYSHTALYQDAGDHVIKSTAYVDGRHIKIPKILRRRKENHNGKTSETGSDENTTVDQHTRTNTQGSGTFGAHTVLTTEPGDIDVETNQEEEEEETPQMTLWMTLVLLVIVTVVVAVTAEFLVGSIDGLVERSGINKEFVGIILLPIVGNAAEHVTAVTVSVKDKLTLSLSVAVGSSIQIALFVIPFIVTLGWILGKPLTMLFDPYESITLFLGVLTVNYVVQDGKSNWLEGLILMCLYVILGVTFWFYPGSDPSGLLAFCHQ